MTFLKVLEGRHLGNSVIDEGRFHDFAFDLLLEKLSCNVKDEFSCLGCYDFGTVHYEVPPFVSKFTTVPDQENILAVADEDGIVSLIDTCKGSEEGVMIRFHAHNNAIFDLAWMEGEKKFVTVSGDQKAILWDVPKQTEIAEFKGHLRSIKTVDFRPNDKAVFATGSRDGNIMIWDLRSQKKGGEYVADSVLRNVHTMGNRATNTPKQKKQQRPAQIDSLQSVTVVLFQDDVTLISAGAADGIIKVWDLRKNYGTNRRDPLPKFTFPYAGQSVKRHGYSNLLLDASGCKLFANCTDHIIYEFNCASYAPEPIATYYGHENFSFFVKSVLSPNGKYILSGSSDKNAYIWKTGNPGMPCYRLSGHSAEVTSVDWCKAEYDPLKIVTCSDDSKFRVWRSAKRPNEDESEFIGRSEKLDSKKRELNEEFDNLTIRSKSLKKCPSSQLHSGFVRSPVTIETLKLSCGTLRTPKNVNMGDHELPPKRFKSDEPLTTPVGFESHRRSAVGSMKRPLTGKCLFVNDGEVSPLRSPKRLREGTSRSPRKENLENSISMASASPNRSPLKNVTLNLNAMADRSELFSPTRNLPNSVFDQQILINDCYSKKRPQCEHWLAKLANSKREEKISKSSNLEKMQKSTKSPRSTNRITKYFSVQRNNI